MKLETELELLQVNDGDTVLLRFNPELHPHPEARAGARLREYFKQIGTDATVLVVPFGMDIETLDEDEMRLYGWVRPERRPAKPKAKKAAKARKAAPKPIPGPATPAGPGSPDQTF